MVEVGDRVEEKSSTLSFNERLSKLLSEAYPDSYEIVQEDNDVRKIVIRFPEITISNGRKSRLLKDLFIYFSVNETRMVDRLHGIRTTFFYDEARSQYLHSHLPRRAIINGSRFSSWFTDSWGSFCTGSSEFSMLQGDLLSTANKRFNWDKFEQYLYFIPIYLGWESLEGGPYIRMSNISDGASASSYKFDKSKGIWLKDWIAKRLTNLPLKLETKYAKKWITIDHRHPKLIEKLNKTLPVSYKRYKRGDDWYYSIPTDDHSTTINTLNSGDRSGIEFKGELFVLRIIPKEALDIGKPEDYELMVHPRELEEACKLLEIDINNKYEERNSVINC